VQTVSYNGDFGTSIAPIFAEKCASCHSAGGPGAFHWQVDDAADLAATHLVIKGAVQSNYMPPWPASNLSVAFHEDRSLSPDQVAAITAWSDDGGKLDVDPATPIVAPNGVLRLDGDVEIPPHERYQGSTAVSDDYRCFIYDLGVTEPTWMQGYEFLPEQASVVHHAVGYLIEGNRRAQAEALSAQDDGGGWQCYGGPGVQNAGLFIGWAPGQQPTVYPEGSGVLVEPGTFVIIQIHYHFESDAPEDGSTLAVDWAGGLELDLDPIHFGDYLGPAEIPCSADESGPLCDRDNAMAYARERFGVEGTFADVINRRCGATPADFAGMTNGTASSACTTPARTYGEIVSIFGHEHELGTSLRLTLNAGQPDEQVLLDIPEWSFDWQLNYEPADSIILEPGDNILLECAWDRSLRPPDLEPAYILFADGTDDEMCFATINTRAVDGVGPVDDGVPGLEAALSECIAAGGIDMPTPPRDQVDAATEMAFRCSLPDEIADQFTDLVTFGFSGLLASDGHACMVDVLRTTEGVRDAFAYNVEDSTTEERQPIADLVASCSSLSETIAAAGFAIPDTSTDCVNEAGRKLITEAMLNKALPEESAFLPVVTACL